MIVCVFFRFFAADVFIYFRQLVVRSKWKSRGVFLGRGISVQITSSQTMDLKAGVRIGRGTMLITSDERNGNPSQVSRLIIGEDTVINEFCNLRAAGGDIIIGRKCLVAQFVSIIGSNHSIGPGIPIIDQGWDSSKTGVSIEDDVWIGANVVILPGAVIERGAVIAAGALIRSRIPAYEIWGGVPARKLGQRRNFEPP